MPNEHVITEVLDLDARIVEREAAWAAGLCWSCGEESNQATPVEGEWPLCDTCSRERLKTAREEDPNPYSRVWDSADALESTLREWAKNNILLCPSYEVMATRHADTAKYLFRMAREAGPSPEGRAIFQQGLAQVRISKGFAQTAVRINRQLR